MNLSRFTTLLVILSIRLFFVTERVTQQGCYDASFFLLTLLAVEFARLVPLGLVGKLWYDRIALVAVGIARYFLIARVRFGVGTINV